MSTHHTYNVFYYNTEIVTTVTHSASVVDDWIHDVYDAFPSKLDNLIVGLDIEWRRTRTRSTRNRVAVLQLCVGRRCLIFQFSCCDGIPKSLDVFLGNKKFIFVGVGTDSHARKLQVDSSLEVARTEELGSLAAYKLADTFKDSSESRKFHDAKLKQLAKDVLNRELPAKDYIEWSNWGRDFLSDEQVEHACLDAFVSYKLGVDLMKRANPKKHTSQNTNRQILRNLNKAEEGKTKQPAPLKSNGGNKTNGTNSRRTNE
ncbi:hypothetical protein MKW94_017612 [Papaver nudicaule]|uniref:3'-5' exonuclease domain-containing protein n=1 Tax=Papaver nudicaule TaxID=74823 RepID=A0AA41UYX5_PAPNU|nr:hypothetical protein [Papaver nudicaule]